MEYNHIPTIRELLDNAPGDFDDAAFVKYVRDGKVEEKSFSKVRNDSLAFCRMLRDTFSGSEHIALVGQSSYEYIISLTGILISGNIAIPVAPEISSSEAAELFKAADVTAVLYSGEFEEKTDEIKKSCPLIKKMINMGDYSAFESMYEKYSDNSEYAHLSDFDVDPKTCALIMYTSGTTGIRKGVMLSTAALVNNVMYTPYCENSVKKDVKLSVLPMYHIFSFVSDYITSLKNGSVLCLNGDIRNLFKNLQIFKPRSLKVVPMIAKSILNRIGAVIAKNPEIDPVEAAKQVTGGNLEWILSGGAYLDPEIPREFEKFGIHLRQGYGMSELASKITVPDESISMESVGRVMDICKVRIRNGEIQVKSPCVMLGYYKMPEETAKMFTEDGWLKTGDIGRVTEYGELFVTGRVKNLIILSNGENVSPEEIEQKYKNSPVVREVMVYDENDRLTAEIYPDFEYAKNVEISDVSAEIEKITDSINLNALPSHTVTKVIVRKEPFEKTSTGKLKRIKN